MNKDDFFVIAYYLLSHLYWCLKHGKRSDKQFLTLEAYPVNINERYLMFIYSELLRKGYVTGVIIGKTAIPGKGREKALKSYKDAQIMADGIEYLQRNSTMGKAWNAIQDSGGLLLEIVNSFK